VSVAHELLSDDKLDPERFTVAGFADTRPLVANENDVGRERNRRVEIVIHQGVDKETRDKLQVLREEDPEAYKELGVEDTFDLFPNEIF
jgi:chemotaxis protein MotB